jgi:hypothetical protein
MAELPEVDAYDCGTSRMSFTCDTGFLAQLGHRTGSIIHQDDLRCLVLRSVERDQSSVRVIVFIRRQMS